MRQLRLERRQTQEEFWIDFLKMSVDFGSMVERGITAPSFETIENICASLGITETELFTFPETTELAGSRGRVKKTAEERQRVRMVKGKKPVKKSAQKRKTSRKGR
jgi:transcriptional regulator with XRE-family HTH domain